MNFILVVLFLSFAGKGAAENIKSPSDLQMVCLMPPSYDDVQSKLEQQTCKQEFVDYNLKYKALESTKKLDKQFLRESDEWQTKTHEENNPDAWKKSPHLVELQEKRRIPVQAFNRAQAALTACQKKANENILFKLPVYREPNEKSPRLGEITINGEFKFAFVDHDKQKHVLTLDLYDGDESACQTLWDQKGDWYEIPGPFPGDSGWINPAKDWHQKRSLIKIEGPVVVRGFPEEYEDGFFIKEVKAGFIVGRKEMPYDISDCGINGKNLTETQEKAEIQKMKEEADKVPLIRIPIYKAFDSEGRILPKIKYTGGC